MISRKWRITFIHFSWLYNCNKAMADYLTTETD